MNKRLKSALSDRILLVPLVVLGAMLLFAMTADAASGYHVPADPKAEYVVLLNESAGGDRRLFVSQRTSGYGTSYAGRAVKCSYPRSAIYIYDSDNHPSSADIEAMRRKAPSVNMPHYPLFAGTSTTIAVGVACNVSR